MANISLQGKGLSGRIPSALSGLADLTGLYLHFNALIGEIPKEICSLSKLTDLYLNVNNLSGPIPIEIGNLSNLQGMHFFFNVCSSSLLQTKLQSSGFEACWKFEFNIVSDTMLLGSKISPVLVDEL